jgi:hypothetical protein
MKKNSVFALALAVACRWGSLGVRDPNGMAGVVRDVTTLVLVDAS